MARTAGIPSRTNLSGPTGLVVSIIAQAYQDAHSKKPSIAAPARQWFRTEDYQTYLHWLGLPPDWQPDI
ncbi:MAG: hypothetical protein IPH82_27960 [Chloroflexi bacterium]|nr:hypothetical protein [Chloroflexota bacterium]